MTEIGAGMTYWEAGMTYGEAGMTERDKTGSINQTPTFQK